MREAPFTVRHDPILLFDAALAHAARTGETGAEGAVARWSFSHVLPPRSAPPARPPKRKCRIPLRIWAFQVPRSYRGPSKAICRPSAARGRPRAADGRSRTAAHRLQGADVRHPLSAHR